MPELDADQRAVVEHPGGPLLVLAGPGTGKTTTLVETVVDRVANRGLSPDQILVLTFGRKAATELRDRITARLGRTTPGAAVDDVPRVLLRAAAPVHRRRTRSTYRCGCCPGRSRRCG